MNLKRFFTRYLYNFKYSIYLKKPLLILRIINCYLKILFLRKTPLRYIDLAVTYNCNSNCRHCSARILESNKKMISLEEYKDIAKQCHKLGLIMVGFTGGEPLLYSYIEEVIKIFKPYKTMISIKTNGFLLNQEKLEELKGLGVDSLSISLDSPVASEHDKFRGVNGAFDKSLNAIRLALENRFMVIVSTVISHDNIKNKNIIGLLEMTKKMGVLISLSQAVPVGRWKGNKKILLTEEDQKYLYNFLLKKYPHARTDFDANFMKYGCGAVIEKLYITPYGDVMPCPFIHISFGNVLKESLENIRERGLKNNLFNCYHKKCYAAEDEEFIKKYLSITFNKENLPVNSNEVFK